MHKLSEGQNLLVLLAIRHGCHNLVKHQSIPAVPIPPGNLGAFAHVDSPGGGALANLIAARGLGISILVFLKDG